MNEPQRIPEVFLDSPAFFTPEEKQAALDIASRAFWGAVLIGIGFVLGIGVRR